MSTIALNVSILLIFVLKNSVLFFFEKMLDLILGHIAFLLLPHIICIHIKTYVAI